MLAGEETTRPTRFDELYAAEFVAVARLAYLIVRSQAVAEELAQDAFLRLYERLAEVDNPPGFLRTVVVRLASTWQRRHKMEAQRLTLVDRPRDAAEFEIDETWNALGRLRPERSTVLVLRFYGDWSHAISPWRWVVRRARSQAEPTERCLIFDRLGLHSKPGCGAVPLDRVVVCPVEEVARPFVQAGSAYWAKASDVAQRL